MIDFYNSKDELKQILEKSDLIFRYYDFSSLEELDNKMNENIGKIIYGSNPKEITIEGITIKPWSKWFIPYSNPNGDMICFAVYPDTDLGFNYVIGKNNGAWKKPYKL